MIGLETPGYVNDPNLYKPEELKLAFYTLDASVNQINQETSLNAGHSHSIINGVVQVTVGHGHNIIL